MTDSTSVIVRMYRGKDGRGLLGDCFLLLVRTKDQYFSILVDCGVLQGTPGDAALMQDIVKNVYDTVSKLDLVVVTHEHWDHIAGFQHAAAMFEQKRFDQLWMAWTEDPADAQGQELQARFGNAHAKLAALSAAVAGTPAAESTTGGLMGFSGPLPPADGKAARGSRKIYDNLRKWARDGTKYLSPNDIVDVPGGLKAYVLGPPRDEKLLFKSLPSSGENKETYLTADATDDDRREAQAQSAFPRRYRWKSYWDVEKYSGDNPPERWVRERYFEDSRSSGFDRRIDDQYAMAFNRLAIRMDSNTNNSSLVLAFELPDQSTMIFAADAQVGNWLSWGKATFEVEKDKTIGGGNLLNRARLYKVGHHGSHNATLKEQGLELMIRDDLVALISTDAKFALTQGKGWLMPNPRVSAALNERTKGRVVRGDQPADAEALKERIKNGDGGLYVDVLAYGEWPKDYPPNSGVGSTQVPGAGSAGKGGATQHGRKHKGPGAAR